MEELPLQPMNKKKYNMPGSRDMHREMNYARIRAFQDTLEWECEKNGTELEYVPAAYTSQTCCLCGYVDKHNRQTQALFLCVKCKYEINADYNASTNITVDGGGAAGLVVYKRNEIAYLFGLLRKRSLMNESPLEHIKLNIPIEQIPETG